MWEKIDWNKKKGKTQQNRMVGERRVEREEQKKWQRVMMVKWQEMVEETVLMKFWHFKQLSILSVHLIHPIHHYCTEVL